MMRAFFLTSLALAGFGAVAAFAPVPGLDRLSAAASEKVVLAPASAVVARETGRKVAIFAGGCFWGVEAVFSHVKGVSSAVSGYHGGTASDADYDRVSMGATRHAESVRVEYDPAVVRYDELLRIFFSVVADPTTLNRQGPDSGAHYRTALVPLSKEQERVARAYLAQLDRAGTFDAPIVTRIEAHKGFYKAEDYHQDFMQKNPAHPYILRWDAPKVAGLKRLFAAHWRARPVTG